MAKERGRAVPKRALTPEDEFTVWVEGIGGFIVAEPRMLSALFRLYEARRKAWQNLSDPEPWNHAVSLAALRADHQLTDAEIRSFVDRGFVEFKLETTRAAGPAAKSSATPQGRPAKSAKGKGKSGRPRDGVSPPPRRTFRKVAALTFARSTCFILTQAGIEITCKLLADFSPGRAESLERAGHGDGKATQEEKFGWDARRGLWTLNGELIRKVAPSAKRLRALLESAQANNWLCPIPSPFADEHSNSRARVKHLCRELSLLNEGQGPRRVKLRSCDKGRSFEWKILV